MSFENPLPPDQSTNLQRLVTLLVRKRLRDVGDHPAAAVARLRSLEQATWNAGADRQTLQVITSGRRLLGDTTDLTPDVLRRKSARKFVVKPMHAVS